MDVKEANELISQISDVFDYQVQKRGLLESQLFPVTAYICVSFYNSYDFLYNIIKQVSEKTTPEKMGKESRRILSEIHTLSIIYIPLYYLEGRMGEIHRNDGDPKSEPEEKRKETIFLLDFWKRLASSYFKERKLFVYPDSNGKNLALDQPEIDWTLEQIKDVSKEKARKVRRTMANLENFSFLDECEARAKLHDHGPYQINDEEILVFREISHLYDGGKPHFPWSETKANAPYSNIAFAYRLKNVNASFDNFATMTTEPMTWGDKITGVALMRREGDNVMPLDFDILDGFNDYAIKAQRELYIKFSKWDKKQRLLAGAFAYIYGYTRYTNFVGITDQINWDFTEKIKEIYIPEFMENDFDPGISRHFRSKAKKKKGGPSLYLLPED